MTTTRPSSIQVDYLSVFRQVELEHLGIVLEAKRLHRPKNILAVDSLALLELAPVACCYIWVQEEKGRRLGWEETTVNDRPPEKSSMERHQLAWPQSPASVQEYDVKVWY